MSYFAVLDTETNWKDDVMSIGIVLAHCATMRVVDSRYYIFTPECEVGGMYSGVLELVRTVPTRYALRDAAMDEIKQWLYGWNVSKLFAYNACFDRNHLTELSHYDWYDIMRIAAYRQHNVHIPADAQCCRTGRLKRDYGVEPMLRLLSGNRAYSETHNALFDAEDELEIMKLLSLPLQRYEAAKL